MVRKRSKSSRIREMFQNLRRNSSSYSVSRVTQIKRDSSSEAVTEKKPDKSIKRSQSAPPNSQKTRTAENGKLFEKVRQENANRSLNRTKEDLDELEQILKKVN
ncbi:hypothetical protein L596_011120 [Steinernema carpocapsae]|uniref:Uncharacterized protein n=1 Tax=Steinernema carpocapsae TaxID=34508 RepID=A0A4V6A4D1_STECR|nr:hypothetical protein L596_011120 [Steinernema carpocapsae]